jgi:inorganic pyrophosphatase
MAIALDKLPARDGETGRFNVVVDTPKGSRNKYKFDDKTQVWRLSKILPLGASFPFDFGFIPSTKGEDGDPVDVLVLSEEPAFAGCVLPAVLVGIIEAEQTEKGKTVRNDRLIAVIETPHNQPPVRSLEELGEQRLAEIEHFFVAYNEMEGREFKVLRRRGAGEAEAMLNSTLID